MKLDELKEKVKAGKIDYVDYFFKDADAPAPFKHIVAIPNSVDRCKECGCTIGQHAPGVPTAVARQVDGMYESISQATVENIDGVPTSDLQVMCSPKGWPAETGQQLCFVRNDVVAIADEFLKDATESIVIIGQPGTGKSFAGGYIVNRCLSAGHKLVVYVVRDSIYAFDADARTCSIVDRRTDAYIDIDRQHPDCILVYDCVKFFPQPPTGKRQGVVAISSPGDGQYAEWAKQVGASKKYVDLWSHAELRAACSAMKLDPAAVMKRCEEFGPIPRHIFSEKGAADRREDVKAALGMLAKSTDPLSELLKEPTDDKHPSHKLMMMKKQPPGSRRSRRRSRRRSQA